MFFRMSTFNYLIEALISNDFLMIAAVFLIRLRVGSFAIDDDDEICLFMPLFLESDAK